MDIEVRMAIMSHLSDAQEAIQFGDKKRAVNEINYAKRMMNHYRNDIIKYVSEDELTKVCLGEKV
jgi:hypothetical protein